MADTQGFAYLQDCFQRNASRTLFTLADGGTITYADAWQRAQAFAARLAELGVQPNDRVLIRLENSENFLLLYLACAIGGFVACPIDPALPDSRIAAIKKQVEPRYVCEAANQAEWTAAPGANVQLKRPTESEPDFLIILSSGTTGTPKGIVHTVQSIVESARSFAALAEHDTETVVYHHFPMFYMAGVFNLFFCPAVSGSRIVVGPRFSGAQMIKFWDAPRKHGVNHLTLTPTMALSLIQLYRTDAALLEHLERYEGIISTGSALYPGVAERFHQTFGVPLRSCYGVTEVGGSITLQTWEDAVAREAVGSYRPEVRLVAGDGPGAPAELRIKTPFMMRGYLVDGKIVSGTDSEGYFHSGDLGYLANGRLYLTGREHDLIKKGGEFVPLLMIEDIALRQPGILDAAAVAVPDDFWGNKIVLFYVPRPDHELEDIELKLGADFGAQLRKIEHPDKLIPVPRMPKTSIGKTIKRDLVKRYTI